MENKKISFGFSKTAKKPDIRIKREDKREIIECLESNSIKIKDAVEVIKAPLVIPIRDSTKNLLDRIKESKGIQVKTEIDSRPDSELTIDELAARELIREAQNRDEVPNSVKIKSLPLSDQLVLDGKEESTLEDYENVPITDYGMALLKGMGWKEGMPIGKNPAKNVKNKVPELRPKGLGLGADKLVNNTKPTLNKDGKELLLIKGAFAKIIAGSHKGKYCQIVGLDDENCRIIVKTARYNEILTLNEFLVVPITEDEYNLGIKVINNAKYEQFKELSDKRIKHERNQSSHSRNRSRSRSKSQDRNKGHRERYLDEEKLKSRRKHKKYSNSTDSDEEIVRKHRHKEKHSKKHSSKHKKSKREKSDSS